MITEMIAPMVDDLVTVDLSWGDESVFVRGPVVGAVDRVLTVTLPDGLDGHDAAAGDDVVVSWHRDDGPAAARARIRSVRHGGTTLSLELADAFTERRQRSRDEVSWECRWRVAGDVGAGRMVDVGIGGARIEVPGAGPVVDSRVELACATSNGVIELRGRVVAAWVVERAGTTHVRIRFEDLALEELLALGEVVRANTV